MYSLTVVIISSIAALVVGLGLGALLGRRLSQPGRQRRELERRLNEVLQQKQAYEDEVVEHFSEAARLVNHLTESYREVHSHLARGAAQLCQGRDVPVALERMEAQGDAGELPPELVNIEPPKDYAPKSSPDEQGMLSATFGLETPVREAAPKAPTPP